MIEALSVASECAPLVKTGGLADVVGALPLALSEHGVRLKTLLPGYPAVMAALGKTEVLAEEEMLFGGPAQVVAGAAGGLDLLVLVAPHLYDRPGNIYLGPDGRDWPDNAERFAALSWMAARIADGALAGWRPEVIHAHDWQAALVPDHLAAQGLAGKVGTLVTIHNIAFQGITGADRIGRLRLDTARYTRAGFEYYGKVSALKAGLTLAERLSTVSPTYADELMRPEFGMGLDGVMRERAGVLSGILNGIDEAAWNPATDPALAQPYTAPAGKKAARAALRAEFGLPASDGPLTIVVSRLTEQKGLDLLIEALPALTARRGQLALLGSGEKWMEQAFMRAARADPVHVAARIGYDEALSHRMMAGADAIVVPSRFEPCGLTQLYGLRYGAVPLVALTGGLADTVIHASPAARAMGVASGIQFSPVTADALGRALDLLCDLFARPDEFARIQRNGMKQPVGWSASAAEYARLYREIIGG